jgi:mono/diheme cytochrome c family protein
MKGRLAIINFQKGGPSSMRSPFRITLMIILALLGVWSGIYTLTTPGRKPVVVSIYGPPIISAEQRIVNVGKVSTDSKVQAEFQVYNIGGKRLRIRDVETSCGCTVAQLSKNTLIPGDFTRVQVDMDTSLKIGPVRKKITVLSNDPQRPELTLFLVGQVLGKPMIGHADIRLKPKDRLVLFQGKCATCHVDAGKGKTGKALFQADCAMCHGVNAQGNHTAGVSLLTQNYEDEKSLNRLRRVIAEGSPNTPQMPPFSKAHGGPLNDDEIDSLVQFLKVQHLQAKMGLLKSQNSPELEDETAFQQALLQPH